MFACNEDVDSILYDNVNGQTGLGFSGPAIISVAIPQEGITVNVPVNVTTISTSSRTFSANINTETTTPNTSSNYTLGDIIIPADSYEGSLSVTFGNFENLVEFATNQLVIDLSLPEGAAVIGSSSITFNYIKEFVCPDLTLNISFDDFPEETSWEVTNDAGNIVASGSMYGGQTSYSEDLCLPDGCYTFTIFDVYADGICCGFGEGSYEMILNSEVLFSGGEFGAETSNNFCIE